MAVLASHPRRRRLRGRGRGRAGYAVGGLGPARAGGTLSRGHLRPRAGRPRVGRGPGRRRCDRAAGSGHPGAGGRQGHDALGPRRGGRPGPRVRGRGTRAAARRTPSPRSLRLTAGRSCSRRRGAATTARACGRSPTWRRPRRSWPGSTAASSSRSWSRSMRSWPSWWPGALRVRRWPGPRSRRRRSGACAARRSVPGRLDPEVTAAASAIGERVAAIAGAEGVMAVELFWSGDGSWSTRWRRGPTTRGTGRWRDPPPRSSRTTSAPCSTCPWDPRRSQHPHVASVNVFGGPNGEDPSALLGPRARGRGRPRAPLWQRGAARTQTGARDRLRTRRRPGPLPRLVGHARPRHRGTRRRRAADRGGAMSTGTAR